MANEVVKQYIITEFDSYEELHISGVFFLPN